MKTIIGLGTGSFIIELGTVDSKPAIFLEPAPAAGVVGDQAPDVTPRKDLAEGGVALTFDNQKCAEVLADAVARVINGMNTAGYKPVPPASQ